MPLGNFFPEDDPVVERRPILPGNPQRPPTIQEEARFARAQGIATRAAFAQVVPQVIMTGRSGLRYRLPSSSAFIKEGEAMQRFGAAAPQMLEQLKRAQVLAGNIERPIRLTMPAGRVFNGFGTVFIRYEFIKQTRQQQGFSRPSVDRIGRDIATFMRAHIATTSAHGKSPSGPYDYPHVLTGQLLRSIGHRVVSTNSTWQLDVGTVGDKGIHGDAGPTYFNFLESGTRRMAPRPFAHKTKDEFVAGEGAFDDAAYERGYQRRTVARTGVPGAGRTLQTFFGGED